jgi:predicted transcriptional regulator
MTREPLHAVKPEDDLNTALKVIAQYDLNQVPVLNQGKLVGILSRANVINFLQLKHELGMKSGRGAKQRKDSTPMISRQ